MNLSRNEQRVLHVLALGGHIRHDRTGTRKVTAATCFTRDGAVLAGFGLGTFQALRRKGLIESRAGSPYAISYRGRLAVRAQVDNQG